MKLVFYLVTARVRPATRHRLVATHLRALPITAITHPINRLRRTALITKLIYCWLENLCGYSTDKWKLFIIIIKKWYWLSLWHNAIRSFRRFCCIMTGNAKDSANYQEDWSPSGESRGCPQCQETGDVISCSSTIQRHYLFFSTFQ